MKTTLSIIYSLIIVCMALATIVESRKGTEFATQFIYGTWWFTALWALLVAFGCAWIAKQRVRRWSVLLLHFSFVIILLGAAITHFTAKRGMIHLRIGEQTSSYISSDRHNGMTSIEMPFSIKLDTFYISYHEGTNAAADFTSVVLIKDGNKTVKKNISMNKILNFRGIRLYQNSYDNDGGGTVLNVKSDTAGIMTTYIGYALLFVSLLIMLIDPRGYFCKLIRSEHLKSGFMSLATIICFSVVSIAKTNAAETLPKEQAARLGRLNMLYNNRICPLQTFAIDFTKKIYGKEHYHGLSAEQVVAGLIFYGNDWNREKFIKIKKKELRNRLGLDKYVSMNELFANGKYLLGPLYQEYLQGNNDKLHQQVADIDEKLQLIMDLRRGTVLKVFPYQNGRNVVWYAPTDQDLPAEMDSVKKEFIGTSFNYLNHFVMSGDMESVDNTLLRMRKHQQLNGGTSLPTPLQRKAEFAYNNFPFAKLLFMLCLSMGFMSLFIVINNIVMGKNAETNANTKRRKTLRIVLTTVMIVAFGLLTWCEMLRWIIGGTIPMANGYETMLIVAWFIMLISLVSCRRFPIVLVFGYLLSGFFLLVAYISNMDPQITHIMPVLASPLLSIHVSIIMMSYALLAMTFICSIVAVIVNSINRSRKQERKEQIESLAMLSRLFLYPSLTTLGLGIFIGAIWANISWGEYWSWDPKETWALITFMVYALPLHYATIPKMRRPMFYHVFMIFAFLTLLMTYFGVNYLLGGMHSYA